MALDIPAKVNGEARCGIDAAVDGMIYARPKVPPTRYGCAVISIDDSAAKTVAGYISRLPSPAQHVRSNIDGHACSRV